MIRETSIRDMVRLENFAKFSMDHINNRSVLFKKSYESNGKLIAVCSVNLTSETAIIFSEDATRFERAKSVKELFSYMLRNLKDKGLIDNHMFIEDPEFSQLIQKHLGFIPATGDALVKIL